jgi:DNA-binding CsgD family transcriptional regulator
VTEEIKVFSKTWWERRGVTIFPAKRIYRDPKWFWDNKCNPEPLTPEEKECLKILRESHRSGRGDRRQGKKQVQPEIPLPKNHCGNCKVKERCPKAEILYQLKKVGAYYISKEQDKPLWRPEDPEYKKIKLCREPEKYVNQDSISRRGLPPPVGKDTQADAGPERMTQQELWSDTILGVESWFDDKNTDLEQANFDGNSNRYQPEPAANWFDMIKFHFPPNRKGIREIARELNIDPGYVSREVKKFKSILSNVIEQVLTDREEIEKKLILIQYYLERKTQVEIADMIGRSQKFVHSVIRRHKRIIANELKKSVYSHLNIEGNNIFFGT